MVDLNVFIVVRLRSRRFPTNVTGVWPNPTMYPHMVLQIVRSMERLITYITVISFGVFVLLNVPLTVVLSYKLSSAIITCVRTQTFVGIHVGYVVVLTNESAFTQIALERFLSP